MYICVCLLLQDLPWSFGFNSQTRGTRENRAPPCSNKQQQPCVTQHCPAVINTHWHPVLKYTHTVKVPGSSRVPPHSFTQSPSPPRSLVRHGQTSPHRPRLVVSRSTCPPIFPPPHANSFVLGPAVINTHTGLGSWSLVSHVLQYPPSPHANRPNHQPIGILRCVSSMCVFITAGPIIKLCAGGRGCLLLQDLVQSCVRGKGCEVCLLLHYYHQRTLSQKSRYKTWVVVYYCKVPNTKLCVQYTGCVCLCVFLLLQDLVQSLLGCCNNFL
jgi:hypothetical protein